MVVASNKIDQWKAVFSAAFPVPESNRELDEVAAKIDQLIEECNSDSLNGAN